jgi:hypothetical protein
MIRRSLSEGQSARLEAALERTVVAKRKPPQTGDFPAAAAAPTDPSFRDVQCKQSMLSVLQIFFKNFPRVTIRLKSVSSESVSLNDRLSQ